MKPHKIVMILALGFICGCSSLSPSRTFPTEIPTPTIDELIGKFSSPDHNERVHAAYEAMFYSDDPRKTILLPYLVEALSGPDLSDRGGRKAFAAQSIREFELYDDTAFNIFIAWVNEGNATEGELLQAIQALQVFPDRAIDAKPGLIILLEKDSDTLVKKATIELLVLMGEKNVIPSILQVALSDKDELWVRQEALGALASFGQESKCTIPKIIPLLNYPDTEIKNSTAFAIYTITDKAFSNDELTKAKDRTGEYRIVKDAKQWWDEYGQNVNWPDCSVAGQE
jgi:HEAT repeat protein